MDTEKLSRWPPQQGCGAEQGMHLKAWSEAEGPVRSTPRDKEETMCSVEGLGLGGPHAPTAEARNDRYNDMGH